MAILRTNTSVSEVLKDGEPTGQFEVKVKISSKNDKGQPIVLDLDPTQAVKHLSEDDAFLNLFKNKSQGGYGGRNSGNTGSLDPATLAKDPAAYRKARQEGKL